MNVKNQNMAKKVFQYRRLPLKSDQHHGSRMPIKNLKHEFF